MWFVASFHFPHSAILAGTENDSWSLNLSKSKTRGGVWTLRSFCKVKLHKPVLQLLSCSNCPCLWFCWNELYHFYHFGVCLLDSEQLACCKYKVCRKHSNVQSLRLLKSIGWGWMMVEFIAVALNFNCFNEIICNYLEKYIILLETDSDSHKQRT